MTRKKLFLTLIALATGSVLGAQQPAWTSKLTMVKDVWLPGEPISATLSLTNDSGSAQSFAWHGQFYLDGAKYPCVDRLVVVASNPIPDTGSSGSKNPTPMTLEPPGSVHRIEFAISRCCNLLAKSPETIGRHRLCYRDESVHGDGHEACIEFLILSPKGSDEIVFKTFSPTLRDVVCDSSSLKVDLLASCPTSTYAGYVIAKKLLDLSDWRFKVGTPASAIQAGKEHPEWATRSQGDVDLFNLVEKHIQGGNAPESLRAVLYCYYGEQLILRGRAAEAEAAFCQAVKEKPGDAKGGAYFTRAQQFLDPLAKQGP